MEQWRNGCMFITALMICLQHSSTLSSVQHRVFYWSSALLPFAFLLTITSVKGKNKVMRPSVWQHLGKHLWGCHYCFEIKKQPEGEPECFLFVQYFIIISFCGSQSSQYLHFQGSPIANLLVIKLMYCISRVFPEAEKLLAPYIFLFVLFSMFFFFRFLTQRSLF